MRAEASLAVIVTLAAIAACGGSIDIDLLPSSPPGADDAGADTGAPLPVDAATPLPEASTPAACTLGGDGAYLTTPYPTLDAYCMVTLSNSVISYAPGILPYDLNTPLFSDYAIKKRAVYVPPGTTATYDDAGVFAFPVGSVLIKSFGFPDDARKPQPIMKWIETRLLVRVATGWKAYAYLWNDAQTIAKYNPGGGELQVSWIDAKGTTNAHGYLQPSQSQCQQCHESSALITPIGPKARNLNREYAYADGTANQLVKWTEAGILTGAPAFPSSAPKLPAWDDAVNYTVEQRARAYLEVNCAHCHDVAGSASTSGLFLWANETDPTRYGVCKEPLSAGGSVGARTWDVVPGNPDASILYFRMASTSPGLAMPQISRDVVDVEAVDLIGQWITGLPTAACNK